MNLTEALGKITDPEVKAFFEKMVKDQNSYITQLEKQLKEQPKQESVGGVDDVTRVYIQNKMREEILQKAEAAIVDAIGQDVYNAVKSDYMSFIEKNMKPENYKVDYAIDAFNLVYGRCLTNKEHPVHQVGKAVNPNGTPAPQVGTNAQQVGVVQNIVAGQPPVMTPNDTNAGQGIPGTQGEKVKSTKDAFARLRERFQNSGGNKFQ